MAAGERLTEARKIWQCKNATQKTPCLFAYMYKMPYLCSDVELFHQSKTTHDFTYMAEIHILMH